MKYFIPLLVAFLPSFLASIVHQTQFLLEKDSVIPYKNSAIDFKNFLLDDGFIDIQGFLENIRDPFEAKESFYENVNQKYFLSWHKVAASLITNEDDLSDSQKITLTHMVFDRKLDLLDLYHLVRKMLWGEIDAVFGIQLIKLYIKLNPDCISMMMMNPFYPKDLEILLEWHAKDQSCPFNTLTKGEIEKLFKYDITFLNTFALYFELPGVKPQFTLPSGKKVNTSLETFDVLKSSAHFKSVKKAFNN